MGGEGDGLQENDVPASTILTRLQKLLWVEPAEAQPKASPLFSHNPPIERMRYLTELTRHYGTEFEDKAAEMGEYASKQVALSNVKFRRDASFADLANHMPSFICSPKSDAMVSHRVESAPAATHLMWEKYKVAPDAAPCLYAMVDVVDKLPIPISISDMRLAGNPLVSTRPSASAPASLRQR